ncbi:5'-nucleotidase C-terminal domain-containing protein [Croceiramulus getboli]|nr:5'-nucleotidase [Flavobacteriaceae bacterium YJPT1-3]
MISKPAVFLFRFGMLLLLIASITSCKRSVFSLSQVKAEQLKIADSLEADSRISEFIEPYKKAVDREMDSVLAYAPRTLSKNESPYNTPLGNMMADAVYEMANPIFRLRTGKDMDAVLFNHGGIRSDINQGPVTTRTAYEIMPFENILVVARLNGTQMQEMVDYLAYGRAHPFTGLRLRLDAEGGTITEALVNGEPIQPDRDYWVCTSDYLVNGGDRMTFLTKTEEIHDLNYKVRNALIDYFKKHDTIAPVRDDRFLAQLP